MQRFDLFLKRFNLKINDKLKLYEKISLFLWCVKNTNIKPEFKNFNTLDQFILKYDMFKDFLFFNLLPEKFIVINYEAGSSGDMLLGLLSLNDGVNTVKFNIDNNNKIKNHLQWISNITDVEKINYKMLYNYNLDISKYILLKTHNFNNYDQLVNQYNFYNYLLNSYEDVIYIRILDTSPIGMLRSTINFIYKDNFDHSLTDEIKKYNNCEDIDDIFERSSIYIDGYAEFHMRHVYNFFADSFLERDVFINELLALQKKIGLNDQITEKQYNYIDKYTKNYFSYE